jgi:uncharacterized membrane protein required for colicin V production
MGIDLLALVLLAVFIVVGALRGALASALSLVTLVGAYAAAVIFAPGFGPAVADGLQLPALLATAVAGAGVFLVAFLGLGLVSSLVRWGERRRRAGSPRGAGDRALGAFFGSVRGVSLALLVGVLGYWLQAFNALSGRPAAPAVADSTVASMSQAVVESAAGALMDADSTGGRLAVRAMAHPEQTFTAVQALMEDPRLLMLRDDAPFWAAVEAGEVDAATERVSFTTVAYSQELRTRFADSGFISKADAADPEAFRIAVSGALAEAGPRIRSLREDPEVQRLAQDPEVIALLRDGNTLGLLRHPGFRRIVDRVTAG